ncbi:hypothetical protein IFM89_012765 [Coptis chinensis]|uniref:RING-type domain-containing protein n=1 Tax=Coptis chinensis TaxID=261450 RepID=A0A835HE74_9MAGN|nr:hypothetical protein IFM89_012765 [Coptis chinensis]
MVMKSLLAFFFHLINLRKISSQEVSYLVFESNFLKQQNEDAHISSAVGAATENGGEYCSVCLSGLKGGDEIRKLPCLHEFHKVCVDRWLDLCRRTCPLCRSSVEGESSRKKDVLTEEMVLWFSSFHVTGF